MAKAATKSAEAETKTSTNPFAPEVPMMVGPFPFQADVYDPDALQVNPEAAKVDKGVSEDDYPEVTT